MADYTDKYKLQKPLPEEFYDVGVQNGNMDKIEAALTEHDKTISKKADLDNSGKIKVDQMPSEFSSDHVKASVVGEEGVHGLRYYNKQFQIKNGDTWEEVSGFGSRIELVSISITTPPTKTSYVSGESFDPTGMVVTATYTDGSATQVTGYTTSPVSFTALGEQNVTVSYAETGVTASATTPVIVERIPIANLPSQSGSLTYTGGVQNPSWNDCNPEVLTLGGVTTATDAGTYTATFTPKDSYQWSDGTTEAKSVTWAIAKAAGSLSLNQANLTLNYSAPTGTIAVTRAGDGVITTASNHPNIATVSVSGNTVTVTGKANGSVTITIRVAEGTNHTAPADMTCSVTITLFDPILNNNTWAAIREASDMGVGANFWNVGDRKNVTINGTFGDTTFSNLSIDAFIIGFNHNSAREGGNRIHFQVGKSGTKNVCLCNPIYTTVSPDSVGAYFVMETNVSNVIGWFACHMRNNVLGNNYEPTAPKPNTLLAALPPDLRGVMKSALKYSGYRATGTNKMITSHDYLWLPSEFEVQGACIYSISLERDYQAQYDYYKAGNSKVKYKHNSQAVAAYWWCRSICQNYQNHYCCFTNTGASTYNDADRNSGIAPCFCV